MIVTFKELMKRHFEGRDNNVCEFIKCGILIIPQGLYLRNLASKAMLRAFASRLNKEI